MATLASETVPKPRSATRDRTFLWLAILALFIAVVGFTPTYWAQLPAGTTDASPLIHLHALAFTAWPLLLVSQAILIERGKLRFHRTWGIAGISLATVMLIVGVATAVVAMQTRLAQGEGDAARAFLIVPLTGVSVFYLYLMAAALNFTRPEWHKRFVIVATCSVLQAAVARFAFFAAHGTGPGLRPTQRHLGMVGFRRLADPLFLTLRRNYPAAARTLTSRSPVPAVPTPENRAANCLFR